jgi:choline dehydrogenase
VDVADQHGRADYDPAVEAEVAIVGGGTAGAVVAGRLAAAGRDVLVIEAGPDYGPLADARWPADLLDAVTLPTSHDWGYRDGNHALDRAKVLGGCSVHNGCTQNWGWRGDYDAWGPGWSADDLAPAFARARAALRLRHYARDEIQPFQAAFLEACAACGHRLADDFDDLDGGAGAGCSPVNIVDGVRWNTAFAYLDPVRDRLRILDRTPVERIEPGRGVTRIHAGAQRIDAAEVVLCGGAYGTPELLLRSGIGERLPGVGRGLQDHPAVQLEFAASAELVARVEEFARQHWLPEEQAILKLASPVCEGPYDLHVYPWIEPDPESTWKCVFPVALVRPRSRGSVALGRIDHRHLAEPADVTALAGGVAALLELIAQPALAVLIEEPRSAQPGDDLERFVREHHVHYWHPGASCPMGPVVDEHARLHGFAGIRIADASIFPAIPRATTAMPTTVVGERVAELMGAV